MIETLSYGMCLGFGLSAIVAAIGHGISLIRSLINTTN